MGGWRRMGEMLPFDRTLFNWVRDDLIDYVVNVKGFLIDCM